MNPYTTVAQKAAFRIRRTIHQIFDHIEKLHPDQRSDKALFENFYHQVESEMIKEINAAYPDHCIEGKFTGTSGKADSAHRWYISGIVGKENFISHSDYFSVSLAYTVEDKTQSAIVYAPIPDHMYMASRNSGATLNEKRIRMGKHSGKIDDALILTTLNRETASSERFTRIIGEALAVRVRGDIALDICQVAESAASAFWSDTFHECDLRAALLVAREAGALVTDFSGSESYGHKGEIVVSHAKLLKSILQKINC